MDALKGISNPLVAENINKGIINNLINHVLKEYDCIIVDTQTIINGLVLDVLRLSNKIFVVSEYTLESTSRVSNLINVLEKKFSIPKSSMKLIMNKKNFLPFFKVWDVAKIINIPIYALIPYDNRFDKSKFLFNKNGILRTRFFKGISKILSGIDFEDSNNVKR
jgi:MinD superfamily P-loop ATPase